MSHGRYIYLYHDFGETPHFYHFCCFKYIVQDKSFIMNHSLRAGHRIRVPWNGMGGMKL